MRKPNSSKVGSTAVKKEIIEIESDTDEVGGAMLALCGEVNASCELLNTSAEKGETNKTSMQIVSADDRDSVLEYDLEYKKFLASYSENHEYLLADNLRDKSPLRLMYNVDNEATDRSKGRAVKIEKSRARSPLISSVSKKLKTENGKADRKSISRTVFRSKETQQKKGDARQGIKITLTKSTIELKPTSYVKDTQQKKESVRRGRKSFVTKNNLKACKKENEESSARRNAKSQTILRASKRVKTIPVVITKDTKRKKGEALGGRKIPVTKNNVKSKSTYLVKDNLLHSFKARKKENEERLSSTDKSYEYFLGYLRNSIAIFEPDRKVKPVKDLVCLSDPDIIVISDYPFSDGGNSPFEANKDGKVIDLEDGIEPENIFNSSFSKKLMEILRKPYDHKEFVKRCQEASLQRPSTRSRQLRDGREIEYNVHNQLSRSYLQQYPEFKKKFHRCRYGKDPARALNLLRGFFFYFENIVLEGAFKPWLYEKRVERECKDILCTK